MILLVKKSAGIAPGVNQRNLYMQAIWQESKETQNRVTRMHNRGTSIPAKRTCVLQKSLNRLKEEGYISDNINWKDNLTSRPLVEKTIRTELIRTKNHFNGDLSLPTCKEDYPLMSKMHAGFLDSKMFSEEISHSFYNNVNTKGDKTGWECLCIAGPPLCSLFRGQCVAFRW